MILIELNWLILFTIIYKKYSYASWSLKGIVLALPVALRIGETTLETTAVQAPLVGVEATAAGGTLQVRLVGVEATGATLPRLPFGGAEATSVWAIAVAATAGGATAEGETAEGATAGGATAVLTALVRLPLAGAPLIFSFYFKCIIFPSHS